MRKSILTPFLAATLLLTGCSSDKNDTLALSLESDDVESESVYCSDTISASGLAGNTVRSAGSNTANEPAANTAKKIVKTGDLTIKGEDILAIKKGIDSLTKKMNGVYSREDYRKRSWGTEYNLTIRIPSQNFDLFMNAVDGTGYTLTQKIIESTDHTSAYLDAESRKKTKDAIAERYRALLKQCHSIDDILRVQSRLDEIQEDAEAEAKRMLSIDDAVAYSTIKVCIETNEKRTSSEDDDSIADSFKAGWQLAKNTVYLLIKLWPFWIVAGVVFYFIRKRRKAKKADK